MRKLIVSAVVIAGFGTPALADAPGKDWIADSKVRTMLAMRGFQVTKLEADDGHWEGEARKANVTYEFHVDPHSGVITKMERDND